MAGTVLVKVSEELVRNGYVEVVGRLTNGSINEITKFGIEIAKNAVGSTLPGALIQSGVTVASEAVSTYMIKKDLKVINESIKNLATSIKSIQNLTILNTGLAAANLVVTAAGFAMMNSKLNKIIDSISGIQDKLNKIATKQEIDIIKEFKEVKADYAEMLDASKRGSEFTGKQYYELTRKLHGMIDYLHDCYMSDVVSNEEAILEAIFVLLPMYANVLKKYDTVYYFHFKDRITTGQLLHNQHDEWMQSYKDLMSKPYLSKLRDHWFLDKGLSGRETENAVMTAYLCAVNAMTIVDDNQKIISCFNSIEEYNAFQQEVIEDAKQKAIESINSEDEDIAKLLTKSFNDAALELAAAYR